MGNLRLHCWSQRELKQDQKYTAELGRLQDPFSRDAGWGRRTPYPEASLTAEWTGRLVHFPACPDMQQLICQWAWQKQCWETWQENGSSKLFSVSGRKRKGNVKKCLHHLFNLVHWCFTESHLLLHYCIYFFLKVQSSCKCHFDLARRSFLFLLNPLILKLQARTIYLPQSLRLRTAAACGRWPSDHFPEQLQNWLHNTASQKSASHISWGQWDAHSSKLCQWIQD